MMRVQPFTSSLDRVQSFASSLDRVQTSASSLDRVQTSASSLDRVQTFASSLDKAQSSPNGFTGSTLYCIGLSNGSAPSTIGSIKSAGIDGTTSYGATVVIPDTSTSLLRLNLTFTGLLALHSYAFYCYVESSTGEGSSLTTVLSTKIVVPTSCCKVLEYLNSPSSVYSNHSKYIGSSPSLYVFTYTLSAAPSVAIKVTPLLYLNGLLNSDVKASPSSANYSSTSLLTGVLLCQPRLSSKALSS